MKKLCVPLAALLFAAFPICSTANMSPVPMAATALKTETSDIPLKRQTYQLFISALRNYMHGHFAKTESDREANYEESARAISQAAKQKPEDTDILILASQIYRSKGDIAEAQRYFSLTEPLLLYRLAKEPNDIGAHLDYAIVCYAGEPSFGKNADAYRKKAKEHAKCVIQLCGAVPEYIKARPEYARALAIAYLIQGNTEMCNSLLAEAEKTDDLYWIKYLFNMASQDTWPWAVEQGRAEKEFVLHYICHAGRYADMQN